MGSDKAKVPAWSSRYDVEASTRLYTLLTVSEPFGRPLYADRNNGKPPKQAKVRPKRGDANVWFGILLLPDQKHSESFHLTFLQLPFSRSRPLYCLDHLLIPQ